MLKDSGTLYNNVSELDTIIRNIKEVGTSWSERVAEYNPAIVMQKFKQVFIDEQ
jgi:hypothetical protein